MDHPRRLQRLRHLLEGAGLESVLLFSPENCRYLTGFTGSNGQVWLTRDRAVLFTDGRYETQANREAEFDDLVVYEKLEESLKPHLASYAGQTVGFEGGAVDVRRWRKIVGENGSPNWVDAGEGIASLRVPKEQDEVAAIEKAIAVAERAFGEIETRIGPGVVERDISLDLEWRIRQAGSAGAPFDFVVASGARSALPHGIATDRRLRKGDPLTIDFGGESDGYYSDMTISGSVGATDEWLRDVVAVLREAQAAALDLCRPGVVASAVDRAARDVVRDAGFGDAFTHGLGHGVGLAVHEEPRLASTSDEELLAGSVVTIEPGIYQAGRGGARVEDMVLITPDGARKLTTLDKDYRVWG